MRSILPLLLFVSMRTVPVHGLRDPSVPDIFFPFGTDEGDSVLPLGDNISSPALDISTGFTFMFDNYSTVFVSSLFTEMSIACCHAVMSYTFM